MLKNSLYREYEENCHLHYGYVVSFSFNFDISLSESLDIKSVDIGVGVATVSTARFTISPHVSIYRNMPALEPTACAPAELFN